MQGFAIIKLEEEGRCPQCNVVSQFNEYMQQAGRSPSFVRGNEGYFRIRYDDSSAGALSAGVAAFGDFLQSSGYRINAIEAAKTSGGEEGTAFSFLTDTGEEEKVILSTLRIY